MNDSINEDSFNHDDYTKNKKKEVGKFEVTFTSCTHEPVFKIGDKGDPAEERGTPQAKSSRHHSPIAQLVRAPH